MPDLRTKRGRAKAAAEIVERVADSLGERRTIDLRETPADITVTLQTPLLGAMVILSRGCADWQPAIHWFGAARRLVACHKAWGNVSQFHGCKATWTGATWEDMLDALVAGFTAAADGSAFQ
jgi:hypothetical protein